MDRRLRLKPDRPGFAFYVYEVCGKKFLGACVRWDEKEDLYDLTDPIEWKELIDQGFTLTSERRWQ